MSDFVEDNIGAVSEDAALEIGGVSEAPQVGETDVSPHYSPNLEDAGFDKDAFSPEDGDYVAQAKEMGWTEPEGFRGDKKGYVGAKRFVERGRKTPSAVRKENSELIEKLDALQQSQQQMQADFRKQQAETIQRTYAQALADIQAQQSEAWKTGDAKTFSELRAKEDDLRVAQIKQELAGQQAASAPDATFQSWHAQNSWYRTDATKTALADGYAASLQQQGYTGAALLNEVSKRVDAAFPQQQVQPASAGFRGGVGGAEPPRAAAPSAPVVPVEYKNAFEEFYEDFGPAGGGSYKNRASAEKAYMSMLGDVQ